MPAGSICGSRRGLWALLTCAAPGYYSQCRSDTTSTVVKAPLVCAWLVKRRYTKYPALPFFIQGRRARGRPKKRWLANIREDCMETSLSIYQATELAEDRVKWRLRYTTPYPRPLSLTKNTSHSLTLDIITVRNRGCQSARTLSSSPSL